MSADLRCLPEHGRDDRREGYLYVIKFSNGFVKVGRSCNPRARLSSHAAHAARFGGALIEFWLSPRHESHVFNERLLILGTAELCGTASDREYFAAADFDAVVRIAQELDYQPMSAARHREMDDQAEAIRRAWSASFQREGYLVRIVDTPAAVSALGQLLGGANAWSALTPYAPISTDIEMADYESAVAILAATLGQSTFDVEDLSRIDLLALVLHKVIDCAAAQMAHWARDHGRHDLVDSMGSP